MQERGEGATFYSLLGVEPGATDAEVQRAYRKTSITLHPDKNPDPAAAELYKLLTAVAAVLKERRGAYDGYLRRGFPTWRGTGYYYARYKPGAGLVLAVILGAASAAQWATAWIRWRLRLAAHRAEVARLNALPVTQVRKLLERQQNERGASPSLARRDVKGRAPAELLLPDGGSEAVLAAREAPRLARDLLLLSAPLAAIAWARGLAASGGSSSSSKREGKEA